MLQAHSALTLTITGDTEIGRQGCKAKSQKETIPKNHPTVDKANLTYKNNTRKQQKCYKAVSY